MVDCDMLTDFNKEVIYEARRLVLDYKKCDYALELAFPYKSCTKIPKPSSNFLKKTAIKAVYGIVSAQINSYLVVVTKASVLGQIYHRKILEVQKVEFICLAEREAPQDRLYIGGFEQLFATKTFYFSDEYDLTNSLQQFVASNNSTKNKRLEYMYNSDWIDDFLKLKAYQWITGFISGYVSINFAQPTVSSCCELALITRRDKRRQGKRYLTRGCDLDGNCANTAETEMILLSEAGGKESFFSQVQLRGSIPVAWKQTPDLKWSPTVTIHPNDKLNCDIAKKHYDKIKLAYESCLLVNLIDKKGTQKRLGDYFSKIHTSIQEQDFRLVWFDFHDQCKNMKYQNLSKLLDLISQEMENFGYFHSQVVAKGERASRKNFQKGILRTNCMDCLDRTNVVQSVFARQYLLTWLGKVGIISKSRGNSAFERLPDDLEEIFRMQWTRNADVVSILYSGTPAMKTDFTATGKRTTRGALNDGYYGIKRYFLGNFYDSRSQDIIDFSLAKIKPRVDRYQRVRHSACNSLFFVILMTILIGMLIWVQVEPLLQNLSIAFPVRILVGILSAGFTLLIARQLKGLFLRKPVRGESQF